MSIKNKASLITTKNTLYPDNVLQLIKAITHRNWNEDLVNSVLTLLDNLSDDETMSDDSTSLAYTGRAIKAYIEDNAGGSGGGTGLPIPYIFSTTPTDADPGAGNLRLNNADPSLATFIYVDNTTDGAGSAAAILASLDSNAQITISDPIDTDTYQIYNVTGPAIDGTGYYKLPVTSIISGGTTIADAANISVVIGINSAGWQHIFSQNVNGGGFKITNLAAGTTNGDSVRYEQVTALQDQLDIIRKAGTTLSIAAGAASWNTQTSPIAYLQLTANVTSLPITNHEDGQRLTLVVQQDATGGRSLAIPTHSGTPYSVDGGGSLDLNSTASVFTVYDLVRVGTRYTISTRNTSTGGVSGDDAIVNSDYGNLGAIVADQANNVTDQIYYLSDGSDFTGVDEGGVLISYNGTTVGDQSDYTILSKDNPIISDVTGLQAELDNKVEGLSDAYEKDNVIPTLTDAKPLLFGDLDDIQFKLGKTFFYLYRDIINNACGFSIDSSGNVSMRSRVGSLWQPLFELEGPSNQAILRFYGQGVNDGNIATYAFRADGIVVPATYVVSASNILATRGFVEGSIAALRLVYSDQISDADPGPNNFRFNSLNPNTVSEMYISKTSPSGGIEALIESLPIGSQFIYYDPSNIDTYQILSVTGAIVDATGYLKIPVDKVLGGDSTPESGASVNMLVGIGAGIGIEEAPSDGEQYGRINGDWEVISGGGTDDQIASEVPFTPIGTIESDNVQDALEELDNDIQNIDASVSTETLVKYFGSDAVTKYTSPKFAFLDASIVDDSAATGAEDSPINSLALWEDLRDATPTGGTLLTMFKYGDSYKFSIVNNDREDIDYKFFVYGDPGDGIIKMDGADLFENAFTVDDTDRQIADMATRPKGIFLNGSRVKKSYHAAIGWTASGEDGTGAYVSADFDAASITDDILDGAIIEGKNQIWNPFAADILSSDVANDKAYYDDNRITEALLVSPSIDLKLGVSSWSFVPTAYDGPAHGWKRSTEKLYMSYDSDLNGETVEVINRDYGISFGVSSASGPWKIEISDEIEFHRFGIDAVNIKGTVANQTITLGNVVACNRVALTIEGSGTTEENIGNYLHVKSATNMGAGYIQEARMHKPIIRLDYGQLMQGPEKNEQFGYMDRYNGFTATVGNGISLDTFTGTENSQAIVILGHMDGSGTHGINVSGHGNVIKDGYLIEHHGQHGDDLGGVYLGSSFTQNNLVGHGIIRNRIGSLKWTAYTETTSHGVYNDNTAKSPNMNYPIIYGCDTGVRLSVDSDRATVRAISFGNKLQLRISHYFSSILQIDRVNVTGCHLFCLRNTERLIQLNENFDVSANPYDVGLVDGNIYYEMMGIAGFSPLKYGLNLTRMADGVSLSIWQRLSRYDYNSKMVPTPGYKRYLVGNTNSIVNAGADKTLNSGTTTGLSLYEATKQTPHWGGSAIQLTTDEVAGTAGTSQVIFNTFTSAGSEGQIIEFRFSGQCSVEGGIIFVRVYDGIGSYLGYTYFEVGTERKDFIFQHKLTADTDTDLFLIVWVKGVNGTPIQYYIDGEIESGEYDIFLEDEVDEIEPEILTNDTDYDKSFDIGNAINHYGQAIGSTIVKPHCFKIVIPSLTNPILIDTEAVEIPKKRGQFDKILPLADRIGPGFGGEDRYYITTETTVNIPDYDYRGGPLNVPIYIRCHADITFQADPMYGTSVTINTAATGSANTWVTLIETSENNWDVIGAV